MGIPAALMRQCHSNSERTVVTTVPLISSCMNRIFFFIFLLLCATPTLLLAGNEDTLLEKGIASLHKGEYKSCIESCTTYLKAMEKSKDMKGRAEAHYWLAQCFFELRRYDESLKHIRESRAFCDSTGDKAGLLSADALLINILIKQDNYREAHRVVKLSEKLMDVKHHPEASIDFLLARGRFFIGVDDKELSEKNYQAALEEARKAGNSSQEVRALIGLALVNMHNPPFVARTDFTKARETAYAAQRLAFESSVGPYLQAQSLEICTMVEKNDNKSAEALNNALSAKAIYKLTGNRRREADMLSTISNIYNSMNELQKGIACGDEAIELYRAEGDTLNLIQEYKSKAGRIDKNDPQASAKSAEIFARLREIAKKDSDYRCRIETLRGMIIILEKDIWSEGGNRKSEIIDKLDKIATIAHDAGDTENEMKALIKKADSLSNSKPLESLALYEKAFSLRKSLGNPSKLDYPWLKWNCGEGIIYEKMAKTLYEMGDIKKAVNYYRKGAECNLSDDLVVYAVRNYLLLMSCGIETYDIETSFDAFDKAVLAINRLENEVWQARFFGDLIHYLDVLNIWQKSRAGENLPLNESLKMVMIERILKDKALVARMDSAYDNMFKRCEKNKRFYNIKDRWNYAMWTLVKKDYRRAHDEIEFVLALAEKEGKDQFKCDCLTILADLSLLSGKYEKAIEYEMKALEVSKKDGIRLPCKLYELEHMARILKKAGKDEEAGKYDELFRQKRMELYKSTSNYGKAWVLWNDGHDAQGALNYCQKALLEEQKLGRKSMEAEILNLMGKIYDATGDRKKGIEFYREVIKMHQDAGLSLYNLCYVSLSCGVALEKENHDSEALAVYLNVLDRIISQWTHHDNIVSQLKLSADSTVLSLFDRAIRILIKSGRNDEALRYLELSHSLELLDGLKLDDLKLKDNELQALLSRLTTIRQKLSLIERELSQPCEEKRKASLKESLASTRQDFFTTINSIKSKNPDFEEFLSVRSSDLAAMQRMLPKGVLLLEYYPSIDVLYIFGITSDSFIIRKSGISRERLYEAIKAYRNKITRPDGGNFNEEKKFLYSKLLDPLNEEIAKSSRMIIVPGGLLWYLPYEALGPSDESYLIESKPLSYMSSANVLNLMANKAAAEKRGGKILAFGAPPESNPEKSIPGALSELKSIASFYPGAVSCTGVNATKDNFFSNAGGKSIIHIASHSSLNAEDINNSFIEFAGPDGKLYLGEIYGLLLDPSCLVTLSSCQSAIGEENPGREFASLASAFTTAGASTVIASQWRVEDEATAKLFSEFYKSLERKESRSESLRKAKMSLLKNHKTSHPFYWAPFVMLGDWR